VPNNTNLSLVNTTDYAPSLEGVVPEVTRAIFVAALLNYGPQISGVIENLVTRGLVDSSKSGVLEIDEEKRKEYMIRIGKASLQDMKDLLAEKDNLLNKTLNKLGFSGDWTQEELGILKAKIKEIGELKEKRRNLRENNSSISDEVIKSVSDLVEGRLLQEVAKRSLQAQGTEFVISAKQADDAGQSMSNLDNGEVIMVWKGADGNYLQRYTQQGEKSGDEMFFTDPIWGNPLENTDVTDLGNGKVVIVGSPSAIPKNVYGVVYNYETGSKESVFQINTDTSPSQKYHPRIATLTDGGFVATWYSSGQDSDGSYGVFARRYDSNFNPVGNEFQVHDIISGNQVYPSVAVLDDGGIFIVYQSGGGALDGNQDAIAGKIYNADGSVRKSEFVVPTAVVDNQWDPAVAKLVGGNVVVAWSDNSVSPDPMVIKFKVFDPNGNAITSEISVMEGAQSNIIPLKSGGFVVFSMRNNGVSDQWDIYYRVYNAGFTQVSSVELLNTHTSGSQVSPAGVGTEDGGALLSWVSNGQITGDNDLLGQRIDSQGSKIEWIQGTSSPTLPSATSSPTASGATNSPTNSGGSPDNPGGGGDGLGAGDIAGIVLSVVFGIPSLVAGAYHLHKKCNEEEVGSNVNNVKVTQKNGVNNGVVVSQVGHNNINTFGGTHYHTHSYG